MKKETHTLSCLRTLGYTNPRHSPSENGELQSPMGQSFKQSQYEEIHTYAHNLWANIVCNLVCVYSPYRPQMVWVEMESLTPRDSINPALPTPFVGDKFGQSRRVLGVGQTTWVHPNTYQPPW